MPPCINRRCTCVAAALTIGEDAGRRGVDVILRGFAMSVRRSVWNGCYIIQDDGGRFNDAA